MNKHTFSSRMKMIVAYIMVVAVLMSQLGISAYADNISGDASSDASTNAEAVVSKDVNATTELPKQEVTSEDASSEAVNSSDGWEFNYEVYDEEVTIKGIKRRYTSNLVIPAYIDGYPVRDVDVWDVDGGQPADSAEIFAELFPELTWDDEPIEVNLIRAPKIIKKKHGDDK